jgi:hypothetical protein
MSGRNLRMVWRDEMPKDKPWAWLSEYIQARNQALQELADITHTGQNIVTGIHGEPVAFHSMQCRIGGRHV